MHIKIQIITLGLILCIFSCRAPSYLPQPSTFNDHVKGLHFVGFLHGGGSVKGEIIDVTENEMFILSNRKNRKLSIVSRERLKKGNIVVCTVNDKVKMFSDWTGWMILSAFVHGFVGLLTIPLNFSLSAQATQTAYRVKYPEAVSWEELKKFARFPQGLPNEIKLSDIR